LSRPRSGDLKPGYNIVAKIKAETMGELEAIVRRIRHPIGLKPP